MNKNLLIVLAVIVVLVAGSVVWFRGKDNSSKTMPQAPMPVAGQPTNNTGKISPTETSANASDKQTSPTVTYTDSGFSPSNLVVKNGQSVTFKNESSEGMWVASAPHPTHTDYPEFDAKKVYNQGEVYSFTFLKTGTWKFHNHLKPSDIGAITVE